ncbi:hypothetical protein HOC35_05565 [Candidatus Woesearchaeota archaeon]|nr:hypothetical protein [Candidatus Woesearchaeota archaeon]
MGKAFEDMTPEERKDSLEFRIGDFDPVRLWYGRFGDGAKLILALEGNQDDGYALVAYMKNLGHLYNLDGNPRRLNLHFEIANLNGVSDNDVFGGFELRYEEDKIVIHGRSTQYGGIPKEVVEDKLLPLLREHIQGFDYLAEEEAYQRELHEYDVEIWGNECSKLEREAKNVKRDNKQRQEIIDSRIGWWARRQAKKKGITTEQYIIDKYNDIPDLQKVPEKPPEPEFKFEPRYKHEVPEFKFGFYMYGVHPDNNKWSFLGFEKKRERR